MIALISRWMTAFRLRRKPCSVCGKRMKFVQRDKLNGGKWYRCGCMQMWSNR